MKYRGITLTSSCDFVLRSAAHSPLALGADGLWQSIAIPTARKSSPEDVQKLYLMGALELLPDRTVITVAGRAAVERDSEAYFGDLAARGIIRR